MFSLTEIFFLYRAANLNSFAVFNMTLSRTRTPNANGQFAPEFMERFQRVAESHGIKLPDIFRDRNTLDRLIVHNHGDNAEMVRNSCSRILAIFEI